MTQRQEPRVRGLKSVQEAREVRGKTKWPPAKYWGYAALLLGVLAIFYYKQKLGELERERQTLFAKQRDAKAKLGERWFPLQEKIEGWAQDLAKDAGQELIDADALKGWSFREKPGIYLRLRTEDGASAEQIRKAARDSLRDGFTACLIVPGKDQAPRDPFAGKECKHSSDCPQGEYCNENDRCAPPQQPFNLRTAYRSLHILTPEWAADVEQASDMRRLHAISLSFDDIVKNDLPLAAELLVRAQYFLVVIDEKAEGEDAAMPKAAPATTGAPSDARLPNLGEVRQSLPHHARVGLWRLSDEKPVLRIRREASGQLIGGTGVIDPDSAAARQRQANSCALALSVRQAVEQ